jgi:ribosomal protein S4
MFHLKKKRYKPFYKQFLKIRKNVQDRSKIFKFKRKKWQKFQNYARKQLRFFRRRRLRDQFVLRAFRFYSKGNSFKKHFRNNLVRRKLFKTFYGGFKKKYFKKQINYIKTHNKFKQNFQGYKHQILRFFENRLDVILYRAKFCLSIKSARQLIRHGHVLVNDLVVRAKSKVLKAGDLVSIRLNKKLKRLIHKNFSKIIYWPIPPKWLIVNYNTCQIFLIYEKKLKISPVFTHYLYLQSVINNINKF